MSPLHFLMSVMVVLASKWLTLKFLQSSIVLTLSDSGINSTSGVYPLFLLGDILALKHPNVDSMMSEVMLCTSSPSRRASSLLKYAMSMFVSLLTLSPLVMRFWLMYLLHSDAVLCDNPYCLHSCSVRDSRCGNILRLHQSGLSQATDNAGRHTEAHHHL